MKAAEMRGESQKVLREKVRAMEAELVTLRMHRVMGQVNQTHKFSQLKRAIARFRTVLTELSNRSAGDSKK